MSVLVKGMEMPKSCFYCPFRKKVNPDDYVCMALNKEFEETFSLIVGKRHDDCPLIEVPPHGRLIDADAINHEDEIWKKKCIPPQVVYNAWVVAGEMPTVIPADKDGET